jgi:S-adenosylmethionine/arginine decarboxylase-like enzyme
MSKFEPIHQHLMIRANIKRPLDDPEQAKQLLYKLVLDIGMAPVTAPQSVYIYDEGNEGLTGSINLATSHIAYHIWEGFYGDDGLLMADVYSCKTFDPKLVVKFFNDNFGILSNINLLQIDRATEDFTKIVYDEVD